MANSIPHDPSFLEPEQEVALIEAEDREEVETDFGNCEICSGPLVPLGALGNRLHLRCRNCGMMFSRVKN